MKKVGDNKLENIMGGATNTLSGTIINAFIDIIKLLISAGEDVGSSIRRISEGKVCPLE